MMRHITVHSDETVPIVTGTELDYETRLFFRILASFYKHISFPRNSWGRTFLMPDGQPLTVQMAERGIRVGPSEDRWRAFSETVCSILENSVGDEERKKLYIETPRTYACVEDQMVQKDPRFVGVDGHLLIPSKLKDRLNTLLTRYEDGDHGVISRILSLARDYGQRVADLYSMSAKKPARFLSANDALRSRLYRVPGAREAYGQMIIEGLGFTHNICIKGCKDPPNPPFSDVAAAVMADFMDKKTGEQPGVVLVNQE